MQNRDTSMINPCQQIVRHVSNYVPFSHTLARHNISVLSSSNIFKQCPSIKHEKVYSISKVP